MSTPQPDDQAVPELDADAGVNAIRLDAERARDELDKTLAEIERRLDPQRVIGPVKRTVQRTITTLKAEYHKSPGRFITTTVLAVGAVTAVLTWAGSGSNSTQRPAATSARRINRPAEPYLTTPKSAKPAKPAKPAQDPVLKSAKKTSKNAIKVVKKAHK